MSRLSRNYRQLYLPSIASTSLSYGSRSCLLSEGDYDQIFFYYFFTYIFRFPFVIKVDSFFISNSIHCNNSFCLLQNYYFLINSFSSKFYLDFNSYYCFSYYLSFIIRLVKFIVALVWKPSEISIKLNKFIKFVFD